MHEDLCVVMFRSRDDPICLDVFEFVIWSFYLLNSKFVAHGDIYLVFVYFLVPLSSPDFYTRIKRYNFECGDKMWKCRIYVLH